MEQLGIQPVQLLMQIINFGILVFLLNKFLYAPIVRMLDERKRKIEEGLASTKSMEIEAQKTEKNRQEIIEKARIEGKHVIEEAKKAAKRVEEELVKKAKQEAAAVVAKGHEDIEAESKRLKEQLQKESVELAALMTERILSHVLSEKEHHEIIEKRMKDISKLIQ